MLYAFRHCIVGTEQFHYKNIEKFQIKLPFTTKYGTNFICKKYKIVLVVNLGKDAVHGGKR